MDIDLDREPLGTDSEGKPVFLADIWPSPDEVSSVVASSVAAEMFTADYADVFKGDDNWRGLDVPAGDTFEWAADSTYVRRPPYFDGMPAAPAPVTDIHGAKVLAKLGDSVTTDHISPAGAIKATAPAGPVPDRARHRARGLQLLRQPPRQPRGDDPRHVRQHPAPQPARAGHRGRRHRQGRPGDVDLRRLPRVHRRGHPAASSSAARSTAPAPPATGRRRAPRCSASAPCSSSRSSASTART